MDLNISGGFNISLGDDITTMDIETEMYSSEKWVSFFCLAALSMFALEAGLQIYKKNRNDLEPIYVFEINTLASNSFFFLLLAYEKIEVNFLCSIRNCLAYYFRLNIFVALMMSQVQTGPLQVRVEVRGS